MLGGHSHLEGTLLLELPNVLVRNCARALLPYARSSGGKRSCGGDMQSVPNRCKVPSVCFIWWGGLSSVAVRDSELLGTRYWMRTDKVLLVCSVVTNFKFEAVGMQLGCADKVVLVSKDVSRI